MSMCGANMPVAVTGTWRPGSTAGGQARGRPLSGSSAHWTTVTGQ